MRTRSAVLLLCLAATGCEANAVASKADPIMVAKLAAAAGLTVSEKSDLPPEQKVGDVCFYCKGKGKVSDGTVAPKTCIPCKGTGKVQPPDVEPDDDENEETGDAEDQPVLTQKDLTGDDSCEDGSCETTETYSRTYRRRLFGRWR